jgi:predicted transcriptional regulator
MAKAGAPPKFSEAHVNWVFWKIATKEPMGRKMIVEETGLGEGSIRTILDKLDEYGLVKSAKSGRGLSEDGKRVRDRLRQILVVEKIGPLEMTKSQRNAAVLVRGAADSVKSGMEQRDAAIKVGSSGVTTLVVKGGKFIMPGFGEKTDMGKEYPSDMEKVRKILGPKDNDVIVVGSESTNQKSEEAAWIAASTLLG